MASCGTTSTITSDKLVALARKQVDYILGDNPAKMSYMVGFGQKYPQHVHHRGSSLPSVHSHPGRIGCGDGFQYLYSGSPNPNVLVGAVLGGPDNRDGFADDRNRYQQSEPATYINAPFVGALAFFSDQTIPIWCIFNLFQHYCITGLVEETLQKWWGGLNLAPCNDIINIITSVKFMSISSHSYWWKLNYIDHFLVLDKPLQINYIVFKIYNCYYYFI